MRTQSRRVTYHNLHSFFEVCTNACLTGKSARVRTCSGQTHCSCVDVLLSVCDAHMCCVRRNLVWTSSSRRDSWYHKTPSRVHSAKKVTRRGYYAMCAACLPTVCAHDVFVRAYVSTVLNSIYTRRPTTHTHTHKRARARTHTHTHTHTHFFTRGGGEQYGFSLAGPAMMVHFEKVTGSYRKFHLPAAHLKQQLAILAGTNRTEPHDHTHTYTHTARQLNHQRGTN